MMTTWHVSNIVEYAELDGRTDRPDYDETGARWTRRN